MVVEFLQPEDTAKIPTDFEASDESLIEPGLQAFFSLLSPAQVRKFEAHNEMLLEILYGRELPYDASMMMVQLMQGVFTELATIPEHNHLLPEHRVLLSQVPEALFEVIRGYITDYETSARENLNVFVLNYSVKDGLVPGSTAETERAYTVAEQRIVWQFLRAHPEFPVCGQILLDRVYTTEASDQSTHPLYADYKALKAEFYRLFVNMNRDVPTTDSQVDIARAASIIRAMRTMDKPLRSVAVAGSGDMARFEGRLFQLLQKEGITFEEIIAVDRVDYGAQIAQTLPELHVDFHQGDILDVKAFGGKKVNMLLYPWSVFSDILPVRDSIQALHTAASLLEPGGIMIVDQAVPIGASSYKTMQAEQATHTGSLGVFERSFNGADGEELWSAFNIMELESFLRDAAQAGFVPRNIGATVQEQHALVETIEADESILVREAETKENLDAMAHPIYQANGWNRMTLVLEYVGQEEALRTAKAGKSLFHLLSCTAMGETEDGS